MMNRIEFYNGETLTSSVVRCEKVSFTTETLIIASCAVTYLITASIVLVTVVNIYSDVHLYNTLVNEMDTDLKFSACFVS